MKIENIEIQGSTIDAKSLNVIVGSNGTGKTRLLHELYCNFAGISDNNINTVYWHPININTSITDDDFEKWAESLVRKEDNQGIKYYSPFTQKVGRSSAREIQENEFANLEEYKARLKERFDFLQKELSSYLSVDDRLKTQHNVQKTNMQSPPNDPLNLLFRNPIIVTDINSKLDSILNRRIYVSQYNDPKLELIVAPPDCPEAPYLQVKDPQKSYDEFIKWKEDNNVSNFDLEGHGVRALVKILISFELPTSDIIFIDEPESHLYPSIKRKFGRIIGALASDLSKQIFLVTHDSDLLQGIFDSGVDFDLIKLYREQSDFKISVTSYDEEKKISANTSQPQYLSIPFLEYAILVEGATDRLIYEHVLSNQELLSDVEYSFISSSGKDSICNPEKIAVDVNTQYSIIFDFDVLKKTNVKYLDRLLIMHSNEELLERAIEMSENLTGIENLKNLGLRALEGDVKNDYEELLSNLSDIGIFIVPNGTLESWLEIDSDKRDYPEEFISNYEERIDECEDLHEFLNRVASYYNT